MLEYTGLTPVKYFLVFAVYDEKDLKFKKKPAVAKEIRSENSLNDILGKKIRLSFSGEIRCVDCGKVTNKSFNQGSCYSCFMNLASNDMCIMRPETCHYHLGTCRQPEWGLKNCFQKHTVYVSNTSGIKVGITKENPVSNRWVDQGAMFAIELCETPSRKDAGMIENELKKYISDKTAWQKMISSDSQEINLIEKKEELWNRIDPVSLDVKVEKSKSAKITAITYPVKKYPDKKVSYKPDKSKPIEDVLIGIKGQYLLFEKGVINIRSNCGYYAEFEVLN